MSNYKIELKGMAGVHVARLFSTLIHVCRMNPLVIKRDDFNAFASYCIEHFSFFVEYEENDIIAILKCVNKPDKNGINLEEKLATLKLEEINEYVKAVFNAILNLNIIKNSELWEGYPLNEAISILIKANPNFKLEDLLTMVGN